jgi:hypothetical protein
VSVAVLGQNSPSVEGVATEGRRGSVVKHGKMLIQVKFLPCVADTTPSFFLPRQKKSTPSKKGEFISSAFIFLSQKVALRYSPSVEGVARSAGVVSATHGRDWFKKKHLRFSEKHYLGLFFAKAKKIHPF